MDPISAIGAVASVVQLASTALSLSKTLYSFGSSIGSAGEDVHTLAEDLKTFSQSLALLSRLLEDGKSWYTDDIYLLTAKIIKDCAELYIKIDKILVKLGSNGKSNWKMRVKFVYKEGEIKKLLKRLRDMKGTLATILMSLQVDLQLSLLNISTTSRVQRTPERPLEPDTIKALEDAYRVVQQNEVILRYSTQCGQETQAFNTYPKASPNQYENHPAANNFVMFSSLPGWPAESQESRASPTRAQGFRAMLNQAQHTVQDAPIVRQETPHLTQNTITTSATKDLQIVAAPVDGNANLKTASSFESFKSALSSQLPICDIEDDIYDIYAIRSILYAFRTALETLDRLISKRISKQDNVLYVAAKGLEASLSEGEKDVAETHGSYHREIGLEYILAFNDPDKEGLQEISKYLLEKVVLALHMHSAEHITLLKEHFDSLYEISKACRQMAVDKISQVAMAVVCPDPCTVGMRAMIRGSAKEETTTCQPPRVTDIEISLPYMGYTFKRFDSSPSREDRQHQEPIKNPHTISDESLPQHTGPAHLNFDASDLTQLRHYSYKSSFGPRKRCLNPKKTFGESSFPDELQERLEVQAKRLNPWARLQSALPPQRPSDVASGRNYIATCGFSNSTSALPTLHKPPEQFFMYSLAETRKSGLWWEGYLALRVSHSLLFKTLDEILNSEYDDLSAQSNCDADICTRTSAMIKRARAATPKIQPEYNTLLGYRRSIISIVVTIEQKLGLKVATLGWACVAMFLTIYDPLLSRLQPMSLSTAHLTAVTSAFQNMQTITGFLARYAVMENLYLNTSNFPSKGSLMLKPEYHATLLSLSTTVLQYFSEAFAMAEELADAPADGIVRLNESEKRFMALMTDIIELEARCRDFKVVCEVEEPDESGSEGTVTEDDTASESDGS